MSNSVETHVASAVALVIAAIAAVHPGFKVSATVQEIAVAVGTAGALVLQLAHFSFGALKAKFERDLAVVNAKIPAEFRPAVDAAAQDIANQVEKAATAS